ncbi:MAG: hypothetical protein AB9M60_12270 [Leptothrix sp. (in: b-proteobacteria)]
MNIHHAVNPGPASNSAARCGRGRLATLALAATLLGALLPAAQAQNEVSFQLTPRDFTSDNQGSWAIGYDRMLDQQVSVGLLVGLSEIAAPVGRSDGVSLALRATHYLVPSSPDVPLQPYVGAQIGGAWHSDRHASTMGLFGGARVELSPSMDLRGDLFIAHKKTTEESLFASNGDARSRNIAALRIGVSFRY